MAADFNQPTTSNTHVNIWPQVKDNNTALAQMFSAGSSANIPLRAVRFLNNTLYLWSGTVWDVAPVAIGGGGTGSQTAADARVALGTNDAANIDTGSLGTDRIPTLDITTKTSGTIPEARVPILQGEKTVQASTTVRGTTQLNNTLTSTSTSLALTAAQGKVLKDTADSLATTVSGKQDSVFRTKVDWNGSIYDSIGYSFSRASAGRLTITHNKNDSSAVFFATGLGSSVNISFNNAQANTIDVTIDNVITNVAVDSDFFILDIN